MNIEGNLTAGNMRMAVVVGRFNEFINSKLLDGARDCFSRHGGSLDQLDTIWVPGGYEIPLAAKKLAQSKKYDAIICLGSVIKGGTDHYDFVASQTARGIAQVSYDYELPVMFGVLTTNSIEQAIERAGTKAGNKGFEAALAAIEMVNVMKQIGNQEPEQLPL